MNKGAIHQPPTPAQESRRPPEPNRAPEGKEGVGTPVLKPVAPSEGQSGGQKG